MIDVWHKHEILLTPLEEQVLENWMSVEDTIMTKDEYLTQLIRSKLGLAVQYEIVTSSSTNPLPKSYVIKDVRIS